MNHCDGISDEENAKRGVKLEAGDIRDAFEGQKAFEFEKVLT